MRWFDVRTGKAEGPANAAAQLAELKKQLEELGKTVEKLEAVITPPCPAGGGEKAAGKDAGRWSEKGVKSLDSATFELQCLSLAHNLAVGVALLDLSRPRFRYMGLAKAEILQLRERKQMDKTHIRDVRFVEIEMLAVL